METVYLNYLVGSALVVYTIYCLVVGRIESRGGICRRNEQPVRFWLLVVTYLSFGVGICADMF